MSEPHAYSAVTKGIHVSVAPRYLEDQSDPSENRYVWAYRVEIVNMGETAIQVQQRYWEITDETGRMEVVKGPGVVGEQPILNPGDRFHYTSGCPLATPSGIMAGHYEVAVLQNEDSSLTNMRVTIPAFSLDIPGTAKQMH